MTAQRLQTPFTNAPMKPAPMLVPDLPVNRAPTAGADTYLLVSNDCRHIVWLTHALQREGAAVSHLLGIDNLDERIGVLNPQAVLLDFSGDQAAAAAEAFRQLKRDWPALAVLGTGPSSEPGAMLGALRVGVDDFIDTAGAPSEACVVLGALLSRRAALQATSRGCTVAMLGARAGLGVTTLATNLALLLQEALGLLPSVDGAPRRGVALLDLGLPPRDGLLYMDTQSDFSFVDGVRNLRRLDHTLVQAAVARHDSGTAVLALPSSLAQVREISHADSAAFIERLGDFFDFQIADLGGFTTIDFIAQTVAAADRTWVVCDQSIGAIVSTANLLRELGERGLETQKFGLVVNKFDPSVPLRGRDIAARLRLPLAHMLPMRRSALLAAGSRGEMLARASRNDPLVVAIQGMAKALQRDFLGAAAVPRASASPWNSFMAQLTGKRKSAKGD